jgi:hypothetical protein
MPRGVTVERGIEMAMRRPAMAASLLAETLSSRLNDANWVDAEMKAHFCLLFMGNLLDGSVEHGVPASLLKQSRKRPMVSALRLLKRRPETGLRILVCLVMEEIRDRQHFSREEQLAFYDTLFDNFFPGFRITECVSVAVSRS